MGFTENTRLREIYNAEHLKPIRDSLISGGGEFFAENSCLTLAGSALYGLLRIWRR